MKQKDLNIKAKEIIKDNIYLTLATSDGEEAWATPLYYCSDNEYNFYFISQLDSLHTVNFLKNPKVSFAIFDSHQPEGQGNGVQGNGKVSLLEGDKEITDALKYYSTTFIDLNLKSFKNNSPYKLFKLSTKQFFVLDPDADTDKRVEVKIK